MEALRKNSSIVSIKHNEIARNILQLLKAVKKFTSIKAEGNFTLVSNRLIATCYEICACIEVLQYDLSYEKILEYIKPARDIQGDSPFIKRLQNWPRGYAGDFETINYMFESENKAPQNTIAFFCEQYALSCAATQQHRNKIVAQSSNILNTCHQRGEEKNILSLACGSNIDLQNIEHLIADSAVHFTLFDMDINALNYSKNKLKNIEDKCTFLHGNIFKVKQFLPEEQYDLISIGGLFDYLSDKAIVMLLKYLFAKKLKTGGKLFFTNIATQNPFGIWMKYFANWELIERDTASLTALLEAAGISQDQVSITKEGTNLTNMVDVIKK